ncbi:MAG: hypothetical protein WAM14_08420 [Candidatus Nitrosopolaris sp.]
MGCTSHKTGFKNGRQHDYDIYKHEHPLTPKDVENVIGLGYIGVQNDFPSVKSFFPVLPIKKKRNTMLSNEEKTYNKKHSKL